MQAIVTGGAGFIGSHLVKKLVADGHDVLAVDDLSTGTWDRFDDWNSFGRLAMDAGDMKLKHMSYNQDVIFHTACEASIPKSLEEPQFTNNKNIGALINVLELAREVKCPVIYSSSSSIYGDVQTPYSLQKSIGEQYLKLYWELYKVPSVSLRYFNVYGEGQPDDGAYKLALGIFLKQYKEGKPFTIVGDGKQRRDFVHVDDVVRANLEAYGDYLYEESKVFRYDVGTGINHSINEICDMIDPKHPRVELPPRIEPFENKATVTEFKSQINLESWLQQASS